MGAGAGPGLLHWPPGPGTEVGHPGGLPFRHRPPAASGGPQVPRVRVQAAPSLGPCAATRQCTRCFMVREGAAWGAQVASGNGRGHAPGSPEGQRGDVQEAERDPILGAHVCPRPQCGRANAQWSACAGLRHRASLGHDRPTAAPVGTRLRLRSLAGLRGPGTPQAEFFSP